MAKKKKPNSDSNDLDKNKMSSKSKVDKNSNCSIFSETDENGRYHNELARILMSPKNGSILDVDIAYKNNKKTPNATDISNDITVENININTNMNMDKNQEKQSNNESIWKNLALNKINLSYAQVGNTLNGRPVLDHDLLVTLLINYGYTIDSALSFIDEFSEYSSKDSTGAIIMVNIHASNIMNIEPLENN